MMLEAFCSMGYIEVVQSLGSDLSLCIVTFGRHF